MSNDRDEQRRREILEQLERQREERERRELAAAEQREREKQTKVFEVDPWPDPKKRGK